jgi:hypothetical protein
MSTKRTTAPQLASYAFKHRGVVRRLYSVRSTRSFVTIEDHNYGIYDRTANDFIGTGYATRAEAWEVIRTTDQNGEQVVGKA